MNTTFVIQRGHLTICKTLLESISFNTYRTRAKCKCIEGQNMRDAVIAIHSDDESYNCMVIRCRGCANRAEGGKQ